MPLTLGQSGVYLRWVVEASRVECAGHKRHAVMATAGGDGRKTEIPGGPQIPRAAAAAADADDERQRLRQEENRGGCCESARGYRSDIACVVACVLAVIAVIVVAVTCSQLTCVAASANATETLTSTSSSTKFLTLAP
ncbi:uncharacterized protein LOC144724421 isoform X1 [Lampetra planeri]